MHQCCSDFCNTNTQETSIKTNFPVSRKNVFIPPFWIYFTLPNTTGVALYIFEKNFPTPTPWISLRPSPLVNFWFSVDISGVFRILSNIDGMLFWKLVAAKSRYLLDVWQGSDYACRYDLLISPRLCEDSRNWSEKAKKAFFLNVYMICIKMYIKVYISGYPRPSSLFISFYEKTLFPTPSFLKTFPFLS